MSRYIEARCPLRPTDKCSLCFPGANGPADCGLVWLSRDEREKTSATSLTKAGTHFDMLPNRWPPGLEKVLKRAASYPEVERIFVHPAIKKALCTAAPA